MDTLDKWVERVYTETDFGRSVAMFVSGVVGLCVYLTTNDVVIAVFSVIITFPISRLLSTTLHEKFVRKKKRRLKVEEAEQTYKQLSEDEKAVIQAFVQSGSCVLTWSQTNRLPILLNGIESLIQRGAMWSSVTADGMRETFNLDISLFNVALLDRKANSTR
jgi:hypothetical protein